LTRNLWKLNLPFGNGSHSTTSLFLDLTIILYSTYIDFWEETRATAVALYICIGSVPTGELLNFNEKLQMSLRRIVKEGIDMDRMAMVISRDERQVSGYQFRETLSINGPIIIDAEPVRVK
jgi:hypothetical protein